MVGRRNWCHPFFFLPLFSFPSSECFFPQKPISLHTKIWEQRRYLSLSPHTSEKWSKHGGEKKVDEKSFFFLFNGVLQRLLFVFVPSLSLCVCNNINQRGLFKTTVWFMLLHTRLIIRALASSSFRLGFAHFLQTRSRSFCSKKRGKKGKQSAS